MKIKILTLFTILLLFSACKNKADTTTDRVKEHTKQLRHIVLLKFNETATDSDIQKVETAFRDLPNKINEIKDFEWGLNNSPEGLNKEFTHCFLLTFDSKEARSIYLPHPEHKAFVEILKPRVKDVLVLDYWVQ